MNEHSDSPTVTPVAAAPAAPTPSTVVVQPTETATRSFSLGSFVAGFVAAIVVAAIGLGVFLVVSDADDDGDIQVDVPAVDVDTGG